MSDLQTQRQLRQILGIDRLLGLDATPLNTIEIPDVEIDQARPLTTGSAPSTTRVSTSAAAAPQAQPTYQKPAQKNKRRSGPLIATHEPPADMPKIPEEKLGLDQKVALLESLSVHFDANYEKLGVFDTYDHITNTVFGEGNPDARLMFVGEGPGADEDRTGRPFIGRAGQKLNDMIAAMGLAREEVYIANIVKLRPPGNRVPTPDEAAVCMPYLLAQIDIIQPEALVCLGATATKYLLNDHKIAITKTRGQWHKFHEIDLMPTFHPAYLLRAYTPENRRRVWDDLKTVMERLNLPIPGNKR